MSELSRQFQSLVHRVSSVSGVASAALLFACTPMTEAEIFDRDYAEHERRILWSEYYQKCVSRDSKLWACHGGSHRQYEHRPWHYCGCVDRQDLFR